MPEVQALQLRVKELEEQLAARETSLDIVSLQVFTLICNVIIIVDMPANEVLGMYTSNALPKQSSACIGALTSNKSNAATTYSAADARS